jgi:hypothetical protein
MHSGGIRCEAFDRDHLPRLLRSTGASCNIGRKFSAVSRLSLRKIALWIVDTPP